MSELIYYKFINRMKFSNRREAQDFEYETLEDLLFHLSYIITRKDFDWFRVEKRESRREST